MVPCLMHHVMQMDYVLVTHPSQTTDIGSLARQQLIFHKFLDHVENITQKLVYLVLVDP